jgi:DNA-binding response OmpR family regulator
MEVLLSTQTKILIVDDEPNILIAIEFLLTRHGFEVKKANDAQEALTILEYFQPGIILLDVMMPGMDGFELARKIRNKPSFEEVRIVFLTAKGTQNDRWTGYASGAEVYLTKPFDNNELLDTVSELVEYG